jgi:hypothetical protein
MSAPSDINTALTSALTAAQALTGYDIDKVTAVEQIIQTAINDVAAHLASTTN